MKVLICGSRGWHDPHPINVIIAGYSVLAEGAGEKLVIIHGDAPGADKLAKSLGKQWGAEVKDEPAQWNRYKGAAGPIRNQLMLDKYDPDVVIALRADGKSNGTDDMIAKALEAEVPTYVLTRPALAEETP